MKLIPLNGLDQMAELTLMGSASTVRIRRRSIR